MVENSNKGKKELVNGWVNQVKVEEVWEEIDDIHTSIIVCWYNLLIKLKEE